MRSVGDGDRAEEARRSFGPDVIMLDMVLPGRDGIEIVRQLAEAGVTARILLVSGHSPAYMNAARAIAAAAGVSDIVTAQKPIRLGDASRHALLTGREFSIPQQFARVVLVNHLPVGAVAAQVVDHL